jgi:hypothetical protein
MKKQYIRVIRAILFAIFSTVLFSSCGVPLLKTAQKKQSIKNDNIYVYPVHILSVSKQESFDTVIALKIVSYLNQQGGVKAKFKNRIPKVNSDWYMNEAKMFKKSYNAFSEFIKTDLPSGENALLIEFLWLPQEIDLHYFLVDKSESKAVFLALINSHHPLHKKFKPENNEDTFKLFCESFSENLNEINNN